MGAKNCSAKVETGFKRWAQKRDKFGKFVSGTKTESKSFVSPLSWNFLVEKVWNQFYSLCESFVCLCKKVFLRAGGAYLYSIMEIGWYFLAVVYRFLRILTDFFLFLLGLNDSGNKFWLKCPALFRVIHDLFVAGLILYGFYWLGIKIAYLKNLMEKFVSFLHTPKWLQELNNSNNQTHAGKIAKYITRGIDASILFLCKCAFSFMHALYYFFTGDPIGKKPSLFKTLKEWEKQKRKIPTDPPIETFTCPERTWKAWAFCRKINSGKLYRVNRKYIRSWSSHRHGLNNASNTSNSINNPTTSDTIRGKD